MMAPELQACLELMRGGSKTFFAASRWLPPRVRSAAVVLYAFCRVADDLVDEGEDCRLALTLLQQRLDAIYAQTPRHFVEDQALALVVKHHDLPRAWLDALLEGFAWDAAGRRYDTLHDVHAYAARVAGSVGTMMAWLMGARSQATLARAAELGLAMQLTNIARDVGEDAARGRVYLPEQWLAQEGLCATDVLASAQTSAPLQRVTARLLDEANRLYARASSGIAALPPDCRQAIWAARWVYAEIGAEVRRHGLDSVSRRAVVSRARKAWLLARAWIDAQSTSSVVVEPPQAPAAVQFLLDAAPPNLPNALPAGLRIKRNPEQRVAWMLELFERLAHERRGMRQGSMACTTDERSRGTYSVS
jgi:phytoene synthase